MEVHFLILPPAKPRQPLDRYALTSAPPYLPAIEPAPVKRWRFVWVLLGLIAVTAVVGFGVAGIVRALHMVLV